jgi:outer membrane protein OmpA-like peptidoglycan-associated protein
MNRDDPVLPRLLRLTSYALLLTLLCSCSHIVILHDPLTAEEHNDLGVTYEQKGELDAAKAAQLGQIKFLIDKRGLVMRVPESFFFDSGQASLRPEVIPIINVLGKSLAKIPNHIRIEGHTDSVPIRTPQFPSNWELSTARATTIVRYLLTHFQFNPHRLSATGYAEFHPIAPNTTPEGRLQNRRVDMVILSSGEAETEPPEKVAATEVTARASKPPAHQESPRPGGTGN